MRIKLKMSDIICTLIDLFSLVVCPEEMFENELVSECQLHNSAPVDFQWEHSRSNNSLTNHVANSQITVRTPSLSFKGCISFVKRVKKLLLQI